MLRQINARRTFSTGPPHPSKFRDRSRRSASVITSEQGSLSQIFRRAFLEHGIVYNMFAVVADTNAVDELFLWVADAIEGRE